MRLKKKSNNVVAGIWPVLEALRAGKTIDKILLQRGLKNEHLGEIIRTAKAAQIPISNVPEEKFKEYGNYNHQGIVAFSAAVDFADVQNIIAKCFDDGKDPIILILDRITDVRNFGAISRSAEALGVDAIVIPSRESAAVSIDAMKTSAGALNYIPICKVEDLYDTVKKIKQAGLAIISITEKAKSYYFNEDFCRPVAIVLGSEEKGIANELIQLSDEKHRIPMLGNVESLNVSVAAGIIIAEIAKQRINIE